jgi:uncharacterized membrane protein YoaK (UPF0700 family)
MPDESRTTMRKQAAELRLGDLLLSALTVSSGAVDAISFLGIGKVFTAFMTGNIVFLDLLMAGGQTPRPSSFRWPDSRWGFHLGFDRLAR